MTRVRIAVPFAVVVWLVSSVAVFGAPQNIVLTFATLPSAQGFTFTPLGSHAGAIETNIFSLSGGVLLQNSIGQGYGVSGGSIFYIIPGIVTATEPKQLIVTARCLQVEGSGGGAAGQQGFAFGFNTGTVQYDISLTPTAIYALGPGGAVLVPGSYNNTTFHDYVLDYTPPGTTRIYRDNVLIYTSTTGFSVALDRLFFGDGTGGANALAEIKSLRFVQGQPVAVQPTTWSRVKALYQ